MHVFSACSTTSPSAPLRKAEFWLASSKVLLIFLLFTLKPVTMRGENPEYNTCSFRYWKNDAFAEFTTNGSHGSLARLARFLASVWSASFVDFGLGYLSIVAAEAQNPSESMKRAFKTAYFRFGLFFIGGALSVGIVVPYTHPSLSIDGATDSFL